jgi:hypothetical protein
MKSIVKKGIICSMLGIMQLGMGASVIEASPLHTEYSMQRLDREDRHDEYRHDEYRHDRERHRHERERIERERHEHEMRRREREDEREWRERQRHERNRHEENQRRIAHDILNLILD